MTEKEHEALIQKLGFYWTFRHAAEGGRIHLKAYVPWYWKWFRRYIANFTVKQLYIWIASRMDDVDMMPCEDPIHQGNFRISRHLEKRVPHIFQIKNGWEINAEDARFLTRGPLLSESGEQIIVEQYGWMGSVFMGFTNIIEPYRGVLMLIGFISSLIAIFTFVL